MLSCLALMLLIRDDLFTKSMQSLVMINGLTNRRLNYAGNLT